MNNDSPTKIVGMPRAYVSDDGTVIELEFESDDGAKIHLSFSAEQFEQHSSRAIELFTLARSRKLTTGDPVAIHPVEVVETFADAAVGGGMVILGLLTNTGLPYHFALTPDKAERLRPKISRAARSAKKQASQSRN